MGENNKLFSIILISLLGLSALLSVLFAFDIVSEGLLINWCYLLLAAAVVLTLVFSVIGMAKNPKGAKSALVGVGVVVVICVVAYLMSGDEVHSNRAGDILANASISQLSGAGILATWVLLTGAILSWIFAEVSKMFK